MIRITKWWEQFENAGSRKLKAINHFSAPSGNDSKGYRKLTRMGADGIMALGVFQALCQVLASLSHESRKAGEFRNSDGSLLDLDDLEDLTRIPADLLEPAIQILLSVGWVSNVPPAIRQADPGENPPPPDNLPASADNLPAESHRLPAISQDMPKGEKGREEDRREEEEPDGSCRIPSDPPPKPPESGNPDPIDLDQLWQAYPERGRRRSSRKKMLDAWRRIPAKERVPVSDLLTSLEAWKATEDWRKQDGEFVPALDRWLRDRKWADPPEPTTTNPTEADFLGGRKAHITRVSDLVDDQTLKLEATDDIPL